MCVQPSDPYLYRIFIGIQKIIKDDGSLMKKIESLGVHEISTSVATILRLYEDRNVELDNSILKCRHFIHFIGKFMECIQTINYSNLYELFL